MKYILKDFSKQSLTEATMNNLIDWCRYFSETSEISILDTDELFRFDRGFTSFAMQGIWYTNLKHDTIDERIEEVIEYFTSRSMPFFWIYVPGYSKPDNIVDYLEAHSFIKKMEGTPGMAVDLEKLRDDRPTPSGLSVRQVDDPESNRLWYKLWSEGYPMPESAAVFWADAYEQVGFNSDSPFRNYIGYLEGEPVATSQLFLGAGVAGLYGVTTLPKARNRGLGTAMSLHPLRVAHSLGFRIAVLDATQRGIGLYRRMGFTEVYTPIIYTYESPGQEAMDEKMKDLMRSQRT